ncbi:MAG: site-specific DNA-methyltransferase, partial [Clostridia bacterium]|nr:site-specific DNA-methyltransferase [Clostridia bacterium]
NTGNDILYKNDFSESQEEYDVKYEMDENGNRIYTNVDSNGRFHTEWLNMMYQRIKVSRDLLKEEGFLLIAIDHNELFNLGEICDELFGYANRIGIISVIHKPEGRNQAKFIGPSNEFMLVYAKNQDKAALQKVVLDPEIAEKYNLCDEKGNYRHQNFIRMTDGKLAYREVRPKFWYPIYLDIETGRMSINKEDIPNNALEIYPRTKVGVEMSWKVLPDSAQKLIKENELTYEVDKDGFVTIMEKLRENQVIKTHWIRKEYNAIQYGTKVVNELLEANLFDFPKSVYLIEDVIKLFSPKDGLILDFFSGSGTTAHSMFIANAKQNASRNFILVQVPASIAKNSEQEKLGYKTICDIGEERIRRAGRRIKDENPTLRLDVGFRVLKLDSSNMQEVFYNPSLMTQSLLDTTIDNIKPDRTPLDLLFQVMLDLGIELSAKIEEKQVNGKTYFAVNDNDIIACFDDDIDNDVITSIAKMQPLYAVFKDKSFATDSVGINNEQLFKTYSPATVIKVI